MSRLPEPGKDAGSWGAILNDFLLQSHNPDGSLKTDSISAPQLKPNAVTTPSIADGSVTAAKLNGLGEANGIATLGTDAKLPDAQLPARLSEQQLANTVKASAFQFSQREKEMRARLTGIRRRVVPFVQGTNPLFITEANPRLPFESDLGIAAITAGSPDIITTTAAHGLAIGDRVRFAERTGLFVNGNPYYVRTIPSSTTFTVFVSNGTTGNDADLTSGTGSARVFKNVPETITTWNRSAGIITGDVAGDAMGDNMLICATPNGLRVGDSVAFLASTIGGIANDTRYWVADVVSETRFRVSASRTRTPSVAISLDGTATLTRSEPKLTTMRFPLIQRTFTFPGYTQGTSDSAYIQVGPGTATGSNPERRFIFNGNQLGLQLFRSGSGQTFIYVDGILWRIIMDANLSAASINSGSAGVVGITFPDSRSREIRILGADFQGLYVKNLTDVVAAPYPLGYRVVVAGDSFTESTGSTNRETSFAPQVGQVLGIEDIIPMGAGSTGYAADGNRIAWEDHWQDVVNALPDMVVWALGINDSSLPTETVVAAAETCWNGVSTALPNTRQIIIGPWPNAGGTGTVLPSLVAIDNALQTAAVARGYEYFSPIQDGLTFTRSDATHPDQPGHDSITAYVAARLQSILAN